MNSARIPEVFDVHAFHRHRRLWKISGLILVLLGLYTILDMMGEIPDVPSPFRGLRAVFVGMVLLIFGLLALYHGYKLPLDEALELVHRRGRSVTESELVHEMRVDCVTAKRIIAALVQKGFLRPAIDQQGHVEEVFEPVR